MRIEHRVRDSGRIRKDGSRRKGGPLERKSDAEWSDEGVENVLLGEYPFVNVPSGL